MAILWMDGFDTYAASADVLLRYNGSSVGLSTTLGRFGGGCIFPNFSSSINTMGPISIPHSGASAIIAGGAVYLSTNTSCSILCFGNSLGNATNGAELALYWDAAGTLRLYRATSGGTLLATASTLFAPGTWHHIEMKATIADAGGICEVRVDGQTIINFSGDTRNSTTGTAGTDRIYFCGGSAVATLSLGAWDDIYVLDTSGSTANDFIGDCRINTLAPTSDAAVAFTRSTGASNYLCVDEGRYNADTDYVESSTVGHIDRYGYANLAAAVATVHGVQVTTWVKKTDAATRTMRNILLSNATTSNGASFALTTSYAPMVTTLTLDPDGSVAWTPTTVNAASAGFEVLT